MVDNEEENTGSMEASASSYAQRLQLIEDDFNDPAVLVERVYAIWQRWADFHLEIVSPNIEHRATPIVIEAATIPGTNEREFVYPVFDYGNKLSTSKASEMFSAGMSMYKMYMTIEKIVALLVDKLKDGGTTEQEVQVRFEGFDKCERKAFESIINLPYNVVVTNFDPGVWGENFLKNIKAIAEKGYGYPPEAPRDGYKKSYSQSSIGVKRS